MEKKPSLTIPYHQHRWLIGPTGLLMAAGGLWILLLFPESFQGESFWTILLLLGFPLLCVAGMVLFGLKMGLEALLMVHFVPEGIAVTLFGKNLRLYPAEDLRLCFQGRSPNYHWIAVSKLHLEQLARRREQRLRRSWMYKSTVDYKIRQPGWKAAFAREQICTEGRKAMAVPLGKDCFWIEYTPERRGFLRAMYSQLPWINTEEKNDQRMPPWKDRHDYVFCRGLCNSGGKVGMAFVCLLFTVPFWAIALVMPKGPGSDFPLVLMACVGMTALFGILWQIGKRDYDEFWAYPDRLRITRGKRELEVIPAEEIRTIFRGSVYHKSSRQSYLSVSRLTEPEMASKIEETCRSREERILLRACRQLPDSDRLVITWYAGRWMNAGIFRIPYAQKLACNQRREQVLRERYPNAIWIDLESF